MIIEEIRDTVMQLRKHPNFIKWFESSNAAAGDFVIINNSFVYRQSLKTVKNEKYLALQVMDGKNISDDPVIVTGISLNNDFKLIKELGTIQVTLLDEAIATELPQLGKLVFILTGELKDNIVISKRLNHAAFTDITLDPTSENLVIVNPHQILVNDTYDEETIWQAACEFLRNNGRDEEISDALRIAIGVCLDNIEERTYASLVIPDAGPADESITQAIVNVLQEQVEHYQNALNRSQGDPVVDSEAFNELLRVAYNFTSDATTFTRLIVSICDLKPLILWGTIGKHFQLSEGSVRNPV